MNTFKIEIQGQTFEVTRVQDGGTYLVTLWVNGEPKDKHRISQSGDAALCFSDIRDTLRIVKEALDLKVTP